MNSTWLNIGCGEFYQKDWLNVDVYEGGAVKPDMVASIFGLPLHDDSIERVYAGHVLEHLPYDRLTEALTEVKRVMKPGSEAVFITPDCTRTRPGHEHDMAVHGGHRWPGDEHQWEASEKLLLQAVQTVFPDSQPLDPTQTIITLKGWPVVAHVPWQCVVMARKDNHQKGTQ